MPGAARLAATIAVPVGVLVAELKNPVILPLPIPHDCGAGFGVAFWRRPHTYLDPVVRDAMSFFAKTQRRPMARARPPDR